MARVVYGDFEWDSAKAEVNERKHGVTFVEAATVFQDPFAVDAPDKNDPKRFVIIGMSEALRVLFVVACEATGERVRMIHARKANASQRRLYESKA